MSLALAAPSALAASMPPFPPGSALGNVITVNSAPNGAVNVTTGRSVASDAAGDFVVVWYGTSPPNTNAAVFAQLYNADGSQNGSVITVSSNTNNNFVPAVAMDASGDFVVVWASGGSAKNQTTTILAQRYSAAGTPQGSLITVANNPTVLQTFPSVGMDASGDFVVSWTSGTTTTLFTVLAQPYNASGSPTTGAPLTIGANLAAASVNPSPSVALDANGDFVVAWAGYDATYTGVPAIFAEQCTPPSNATQCKPQFTVSGDKTNTQGRYVPSVSMDAAGDFVVAWQENTYISSNLSVFNIHAQRYNHLGLAQGTEIAVTNSNSVPQQLPSVSLDALGDFVVTWQAGAPISGLTLAAQRYDSQGLAQGSTIQVSQSPPGQSNPSASLNADGDFVLAWDASLTPYNIYAQRYEGPESIDLASTGLVAAPTTVDTGASFTLNYALANNSQVGTVVNSAVNASVNLANPGAQVSIPLPSGVSFVSASGSNWTCPAPSNGSLTCTFNAAIKASSAASLLTLTLKAPSAAGTINFTATVTGQQPDPNANNNSASSGNITVQTSGSGGGGGGGGGGGYGGGGGGGALGLLSLLLIAPLARIRRRRQDS